MYPRHVLASSHRSWFWMHRIWASVSIHFGTLLLCMCNIFNFSQLNSHPCFPTPWWLVWRYVWRSVIMWRTRYKLWGRRIQDNTKTSVWSGQMLWNISQTTSGKARLVVYPLIVGVLYVLTGGRRGWVGADRWDGYQISGVPPDCSCIVILFYDDARTILSFYLGILRTEEESYIGADMFNPSTAKGEFD